MKRLFVISCLSAVILSLSACGGKEVVQPVEWRATNEYNMKAYLQPIWKTRSVYNETVTFIDGDMTAQLLYEPDKIISVYDYSLKTAYVENTDYTIFGRTITAVAGGNIPYWKSDELYLDSPNDSDTVLKTAEGRYIFYSEVIPNMRQIAVSYEHSRNWDAFTPADQSNSFSKFLRMLESKKSVNICFLGDSITAGCGSSSYLGIEPFTPAYPELFCDWISDKYSCGVVLQNLSIGGKNTAWGVERILQLDTKQLPDLFVIALGMNDPDTLDYSQSIASIIQIARDFNSECEIILVSPMLPNPELTRWTGVIPYFEEELTAISERTEGVAVAPVTTMSKTLYEKGKKFYDINSNNVNHPNDFISRIYAQTLLKTVFGSLYEDE